jgi:hypothetical protein
VFLCFVSGVGGALYFYVITDNTSQDSGHDKKMLLSIDNIRVTVISMDILASYVFGFFFVSLDQMSSLQ